MPENKRYARLKSLLQDKILSGDYEPGDRFFSQTEIMRTYGLSLSTVMRALDELVREGYLVRKQGKGTFVARNTPGATPAPESKPLHVNIFAVWPSNQPAPMWAGVNLPEIYRTMQGLLPETISLRLTPLAGKAGELEPYLFTREPMDAALFFYPTPDHLRVLENMAQTIPVITVDSESRNSAGSIQTVITDPGEAVALAAERLLQENHTAIGLVVNGTDSVYQSACVKSYRDIIRHSGLAWRETLIAHTISTDPTGYHGLVEMVDRNADLEIRAVISAGTGVGLGVLYALQSMGHGSDSAVELVVCDDPAFPSETDQSCARVEFHPSEIALACSHAIKDRLQGRSAEPRTIKPTWVDPLPTTEQPAR